MIADRGSRESGCIFTKADYELYVDRAPDDVPKGGYVLRLELSEHSGPNTRTSVALIGLTRLPSRTSMPISGFMVTLNAELEGAAMELGSRIEGTIVASAGGSHLDAALASGQWTFTVTTVKRAKYTSECRYE